jgi:hypothetical protein
LEAADMTRLSGPKSYGTFADFEREVLRPMNKMGFCVDDLESEAIYKAGDEQLIEEQEELDFG